MSFISKALLVLARHSRGTCLETAAYPVCPRRRERGSARQVLAGSEIHRCQEQQSDMATDHAVSPPRPLGCDFLAQVKSPNCTSCLFFYMRVIPRVGGSHSSVSQGLRFRMRTGGTYAIGVDRVYGHQMKSKNVKPVLQIHLDQCLKERRLAIDFLFAQRRKS